LNQIGQHATCLTKHKCKSKNQNLTYRQAQHNNIVGFQTLFLAQGSIPMSAHT
jgi:hypothetical protein